MSSASGISKPYDAERETNGRSAAAVVSQSQVAENPGLHSRLGSQESGTEHHEEQPPLAAFSAFEHAQPHFGLGTIPFAWSAELLAHPAALNVQQHALGIFTLSRIATARIARTAVLNAVCWRLPIGFIRSD